jgi:hypothetical protein
MDKIKNMETEVCPSKPAKKYPFQTRQIQIKINQASPFGMK